MQMQRSVVTHMMVLWESMMLLVQKEGHMNGPVLAMQVMTLPKAYSEGAWEGAG